MIARQHITVTVRAVLRMRWLEGRTCRWVRNVEHAVRGGRAGTAAEATRARRGVQMQWGPGGILTWASRVEPAPRLVMLVDNTADAATPAPARERQCGAFGALVLGRDFAVAA